MEELKSKPSREDVVKFIHNTLVERSAMIKDASIPQMKPELMLLVVEEWVTTRRPFKARNSSPGFEKLPFGHLMVRCREFHSSSGYLGTAFNTRIQCGILAEAKDPGETSWLNTEAFKTAKRKLREIEGDLKGDDLFQMMDTLALVASRGASTAADAWQRALRSTP